MQSIEIGMSCINKGNVSRQDKLWIGWIHTYYIKDRRSWKVQANQASWVVRKILQAGHWISKAGLQVTEVMEAETFAIKDMYKKLRGELSKVSWRRMICNNQGSLEWTFILCSAGWNEELEWTTLHANRKTIQDEVYRMTLAAAVYYIWQEMNYRIFQQRKRIIEEITKQIIQEIHCRSSMIPRMANAMQNLNFYPW
ncbi:hypothetical protein KY289_012087 [Solanum tuberosum]|nr:hypothetical protein KY289_012087 [Solanum tuberosum]